MAEKAWLGGESLVALRQEMGLTQEELGRLLGYSRALVAQWESGRRKPDIAALQKISELFGVSIDDLVRGKPVKPTRYPPGAIGVKIHLRAEGLDEDAVRHIIWLYERLAARQKGERGPGRGGPSQLAAVTAHALP